jgi:hypothetical protein
VKPSRHVTHREMLGAVLGFFVLVASASAWTVGQAEAKAERAVELGAQRSRAFEEYTRAELASIRAEVQAGRAEQAETNRYLRERRK